MCPIDLYDNEATGDTRISSLWKPLLCQRSNRFCFEDGFCGRVLHWTSLWDYLLGLQRWSNAFCTPYRPVYVARTLEIFPDNKRLMGNLQGLTFQLMPLVLLTMDTLDFRSLALRAHGRPTLVRSRSTKICYVQQRR